MISENFAWRQFREVMQRHWKFNPLCWENARSQKTDKEIAEIKERMSKGKAKGFREDEHETLCFEDHIYVHNDPEIGKLILQEAHDSPYQIHPVNTKMYLDLKESFWWIGMKKNIAEYVAV